MKKLRVTVEGKSYDVTVELLGEGSVTPAPLPAPTLPVSSSPSSGSGDAVPSPLAGTVISVDVAVGDTVSAGDQVLVLEAMQMHNVVQAPTSGTVKSIAVQAGATVVEGQSLLTLG